MRSPNSWTQLRPKERRQSRPLQMGVPEDKRVRHGRMGGGLQNKLMYVSFRGERLCLGALAASVGGLQEVLEALGSAVRDLSLSTRWSPLATSTACIPATQATLTVAAAPQTAFWVSAKTATRPSPRRALLNDFRGGDGGAEPRRLVYRREKSRLIP